MKLMSEFPYGNDMSISNSIHKKMMLFQMKSPVFAKFAFGYYDAVDDVFKVCQSPFINTEDHQYQERIAGRYNGRDIYCMLPVQFAQSLGSKRIVAYMPVEDALADMREADLILDNIPALLSISGGYAIPHLVCLDDNRFIISEPGSFETGKEFCACSPTTINGDIYHMSGAIPRYRIKFAVNLLKWKETRKWPIQ